jgi:hypothetical protein
MDFNLRQAHRKQARIKMGLQGPSGSGKTYSSLLIGYGLTEDWSKIAVIDTENHSADLYSNLGNYNVLSLQQPFSPERYIEAIEACEKAGMEVIIIDSISQEWEGRGGILETHGNMTGNSFTNWNKVTPRHNAFVQKILQSSCHLIATIRSKQDYVLSEKNGKYVPEKVGLKGVTREGLDYEFTLVLELDIKHNATATKDRTGIFMDKPPWVITDATGQRIKSWCMADINLEDILSKIRSATTVDQVRQIYNTYPLLQNDIKSYCIARNQEIGNPIVSDVVNPKADNHGTG